MLCCKRKSRSRLVDAPFVEDAEALFRYRVLVGDLSDDHALNDVKGGHRVRVRSSFVLLVDQVVASVEEFGNVPAHIVDQVKFSARVDALVAVQRQDQVVKNDQFLARSYDLVHFF